MKSYARMLGYLEGAVGAVIDAVNRGRIKTLDEVVKRLSAALEESKEEDEK